MPQSNYRMAHETLLKNIPIAPENVHRIQGERPPQEAALAYEAEIRRLFPRRSAGPPVFTLVLLGLGEDGHTASLFPDTAVLHERNRLVMEVYVDSLRSSRITLTLPVINNAQHVMFLVAGRMKAPIVREVLEDDIPRHPAQLVNPRSGSLLWLVDRDAASLLAAELKSQPEKNTP
jgi:6-phosphogluconolactonase